MSESNFDKLALLFREVNSDDKGFPSAYTNDTAETRTYSNLKNIQL